MRIYALRNQKDEFFKDARIAKNGYETVVNEMPTNYFTLNKAIEAISLLKEVSDDEWRVVEIISVEVEE